MSYLENSDIHIFSLCQNDLEYHTHDFLELVYITQGKGMHFLDGERMTVSEGDYFIIDHGSRHKYKNFENGSFQLINCLFLPEFIDPSLKGCLSFGSVLDNYLIRFSAAALTCTPTKCIFKDTDKSVQRLMESMLCEYNENKDGAFEILRCRLVELIILTVRKITADGKRNANSAVMEALEYAEKNFAKNISLSGAAKKIGISPQYLSTSFKNSTGMTFTSYVQKLRIGQSCRLLSFSDKKIIEIAELSGYNDIKFFNKIFKKHMNITPREFRKGIKQPKN